MLTRRWVIGHVIVVLIVGGCVVAGFWQLDRLRQRRATNTRIEAQESMPPIELASLRASTGADDPEGLEYRRVQVTGRYDVAREVVLIGRTLGENDGNNLLTPLRLEDGRGLVVDRGWVPYSVQSPGSAAAAPPDGDVELTGVLLPAESNEVPVPGSPPSTEVASIDINRLQAQVPYRLEPVYLWLSSQTPRQAVSLPRTVPLPGLSEGPHLSYAIQWFAFATIGVIGYPLLLRREIRRRRPQREETE